jgi:hypothetical protein
MQTIFSTPEPLANWRYRAEPNRGVELGRAASLLALPFLLLAAAISVPFALGFGVLQTRRSRTFLVKMKAQGRVMEWTDFIRAVDQTSGTIIVERYSIAGHVNLWWTPENIYEVCPYGLVDWEALHEQTFLPFAEWYQERYSSPDTGKALFVGPSPPGEARLLRSRFEFGETGACVRWIEVVPPEVVRKKK